jgi:hypothetical protein
MSDFNPLDRAKISTHRSSFDLSSKKLFTAKVGEILPCYWQIAISGTKYRISSDWFTRTVPVNTAAYTRIKEYYDFYAVPLRLISRALPQAFTQMTDYMTSAASGDKNTDALTSVPYTTMAQFSGTLFAMNVGDQTNTRDDAGLPLVYGACKLLDLLGYGSMLDKSNTAKAAITQKYLGLETLGDSDNPLVYSVSQTVNMLPILAYQKIYFDFFSNSQWEKHLAYAYNVDYWQGTSYITLYADMLKMRYANYPKDYFMGIRHSALNLFEEYMTQHGVIITFIFGNRDILMMFISKMNISRNAYGVVIITMQNLTSHKRNVLIIISKCNKIRILESTSSGPHAHRRFFSFLMDAIITLATINSNTCTSILICDKRTMLTMINSLKQIRRKFHNYLRLSITWRRLRSPNEM